MDVSHPGAGARLDANDSAWYLATRLEERLGARHGEKPRASCHDAHAADRELSRLRDQFPYSDEGLFAEILRQRGIGPADFAGLFLETAEEVRGRFPEPPAWLSRLQGLPLVGTSDPLAGEPSGDLSGERPAGGERPEGERLGRRMARLLDFVRPFIDRGTDALAAGIRETVRAAGSPVPAERLCALLAPTWPRRALTRLVMRVLVLELNIARLRGTLRSADGAERFAEFAAWLRDPVRSPAIWRAYPALLRECGALIDAWVSARIEFCAHLCGDLTAISRICPAAGRGEIADVVFDAGDSHRGGRSVGIVTFSDGEKIVYKPRSLAVDQHFQELLRWINDEGFEPALPTLRVISRGDHGWVRYVAAAECADADEVKRFYQRHGGYLALMYALRATDLHFENVIAAGEYPYLVDLEALFGTELHHADEGVDDIAARLTLSTVLATGLLPNPVVSFGEDAQARTDLSGISYRSGQLTAGKIPTWAAPAQDTMRIVHRRVPMGESRNTTSLAGRTVDPAAHIEEMTRGFEAMYRILRRRSAELAGPGGFLERFADDTVRHVLEGTQTYSAFLWDSYHPNLLRNSMDRERYLDRTLGRYGSYHAGQTLAASERRQLADGDIPLFTSKVDGLGLLGGDGTFIDGVLEKTGLRAARERILGLSPDDMRRQQWVIRSAFACVNTEDLNSSWPVHTVPDAPGQVIPPQALIQRACEIGDRLIATAVRTPEDIGWLGISPYGASTWRLAPTPPGLYSGAAGIAHFLLYLGLVTGADRYLQTASDVARSLARRARRKRDLPPPPADVPALGLSGEVDGGLYFAAHWAAETGDLTFLTDLIEDIRPRLEKSISDTMPMDLVDGLAGTLLGLSAAYSVAPSDALARVMTRCADSIARARVPQPVGAGWTSGAGGDTPLCGMAHGGSGVALALARCSQTLGTDRGHDAVRDAVLYENSLLEPGAPGWPDLRPGSHGARMTAWCHGAPGIGTAYAVLAQHDDHITATTAAKGLTTALATTLEHYSAPDAVTVRNLSLCHGELGNLDFLATAAATRDDSAGRALTDRLTHAVCATLDALGPVCGVPEGLSTPGLMTGVAGIGHGLLRRAAPDRVPALLSFALPRQPRPAELGTALAHV